MAPHPREASATKALDRTFVRRTLFVFAVAGLTFLAWRLVNVFLLAFGAVIVAVLLRSLADPIQKRTPLGGGLSLLAGGLLVVAVLAGAGWLFGSTISGQVAQLSQSLPASIGEVQARIAALPFGQEILAQLQSGGGGMASRLGGLFTRIGSFAFTLVGAGTDLLLVIFGGLYLAIDPQKNRDGLLALFPQGPRERVRDALNATGRALKLWLLGTFVSMIIVGVLTYIGALILGLSSPAALGLFAGLAAFVPIVGPLVSVIPGVLVAMLQGPQMVLWTLLMYFLVQQIESNVTYPFIQGRTVDLPPVLTLFAVLGIGGLLGLLGVVFATPLAVTGFVMVKMLYLRNTLGEDTKAPGEKSNGGDRA
ncbi:MAG: AI-2E family transporter [Proteobacteria bacterium]|nr:AI-2E family transporter [Pseudomonadota bacterium]MBW3617279.1 AI-2E family transporter [Pseudomonadota bacterium]